MASALSRTLIRWRWAVIVCWAVIGYLAAAKSPQVVQALNVRGGSRVPTEASRADQLLRDRFTKPLNDFFAVTLETPVPIDSAPARQLLDSLIAQFGRQSYISTVASFRSTHDSTLVSADGRRTFLILAMNADKGDSVSKLVAPVRAVVQSAIRATGVDTTQFRLRVTGRAPARSRHPHHRRRGQQARRDPAAAAHDGGSAAGIRRAGRGDPAAHDRVPGDLDDAWRSSAWWPQYTPMSVFVLNMTTMLGLGVGIDYSLLIVTRFREELNKGLRRREAALRTLTTAGVAVVTSGLTVVVGFAALLLTPLTDTRSVGIGGLVVVAMAVAALDHAAPGAARGARPPDRPAPLAGPPAHLVPRARRLGEVGPEPGPPSVAGADDRHHRHRAPDRTGILDPDRTAGPELVADADRGRPGSARTASGWGSPDVIIPIRVVVEVPAGQTAVSATTLRGLQRAVRFAAGRSAGGARSGASWTSSRGPRRSCRTRCCTATSPIGP